jgi:hypothetical protein
VGSDAGDAAAARFFYFFLMRRRQDGLFDFSFIYFFCVGR